MHAGAQLPNTRSLPLSSSPPVQGPLPVSGLVTEEYKLQWNFPTYLHLYLTQIPPDLPPPLASGSSSLSKPAPLHNEKIAKYEP